MKKYLSIIFFIFYLFLYRVWFLQSGILTNDDWLYIYPQSFETYTFEPLAWIDDQLGSVNIFLYFHPVKVFMLYLNNLGLTYGDIERIVFLIPAITFGYWGSYLLIKDITKSELASFVGSGVFLLNGYSMIISSSHLTVLVSMSIVPFTLFLARRILEKKENHLFILINILLFLSSAYEFRIFYINSFILLIYVLYNSFLTFKSWKDIFINFLKFSLFFFIPILFNFYWFLFLYSKGMTQSNTFFDRELFGNNYMNIKRAITLFHPFWKNGRVYPFFIQDIPLFQWLIPIFAFSSFYIGRKNKNILFFGLISLIGIFLTKQVGIPFSHTYEFLFKNFPGFNAFREASKFYILIALGYSVLIGYLVKIILNKLDSKLPLMKIGLTVLIIGIILQNSFYLMLGNIEGMFVEKHVPEEYLELNSILLDDSETYRTLWIPRKSRWSIYNNQISALSLDELLNGSWSNLIESYEDNKITSDKLINFIKQENLPELLNKSNIKYVIVPMVDNINRDNFYQYYLPQQEFTNELDNLSFLKKVPLKNNKIYVYENDKYLPLLSLENQNEGTLKYEKVNSTLYKLNLNNVSQNTIINFSQSYNTNWSLYSSSFSQNLNIKSEPTNFYFNKFILDISNLCDKTVCSLNESGNYDLELNLYFSPQNSIKNYLNTTFSILKITSISFIIIYLILLLKNDN